ncbi:MAG TPA: ribonuclease HII [Thermodesulfobacteriota bacterium]|nr:ribonuclease HII [Deltaproteobacteria bacterium]HNR14209.1 ribonuclease HII [Thermodesulfobacteriota bacterium]HNU71647.1 ribonuclease HII [Thermodesulfobacteriota bacterium]HOC39135.1 ribonuclease HII [Thermodesulfobacteriota bacterium]
MKKRVLLSHDCCPPETELLLAGFHRIAGVDEAGRGPLAGPVVAAAVILPDCHSLTGVIDSKQLTARERDLTLEVIIREAVSIGVGIVDQWEIDRINIHRASLKAMKIAVSFLTKPVDYVLVDGLFTLDIPIPQQAVKHGDSLSVSIGAASVVAKVFRDRIMKQYDQVYPVYHFSKNKGYGTTEHREAIQRHGYCALHRKSFAGVAVSQKTLFADASEEC